MIIPISHESGTVRRTPWITYLILVLCVAAFAHTRQQEELARLRIQQTLVDLASELVNRPWVGIDPRVRRVFGVELAELKIRARAEAARGGRPLPAIRVPDSIRERHQREFDQKQERLLAALGTHPFFRYGFVADRPEPIRLVTYAFVHAGWLHLLGNLLLLFLTAPFVEDRYGRGLFTAFYLLAGAAAALFFAFRHPGLETPLVGASGAVAGCMGAFLVRFFTTPIRFFYWMGIVMGTFRAPAWLMLPLWVAGEWFMARAMDQAMPGGAAGIAHWAHVGGFGFGVLFALGMRALRVEERFIHPAIEEKLTVAANPVIEEAGRAREEGRAAEALVLLQRALQRRPADEDVAAALLDTAAETGRMGEVLPELGRFLEEMLRRGRPEVAVERFAELVDCVPDVALPAALALHLAPVLRGSGRPELATGVLRRALAASGPEVPGSVMLRLARALCGDDAAGALGGVERVLERADLEPAERTRLESLRDALRAQGVVPRAAEPEPRRAPAGDACFEVPSAGARPGMGSAIRTVELAEEDGADGLPEIELAEETSRDRLFGSPGEHAGEPAHPSGPSAAGGGAGELFSAFGPAPPAEGGEEPLPPAPPVDGDAGTTRAAGAAASPAGAEPEEELMSDELFLELPEPELPDASSPVNLLVTGIGGSGVVTVGALLGMAAHLEGRGCSVLDVTGLAQKNGPVTSHVRIADDPEALHATRIAAGSADLVLGCDLVVATGPESLGAMAKGRTVVVGNRHVAPTADFATDPDLDLSPRTMEQALGRAVGDEAVHLLPATELATALFGDAVATNLFLLGYAWQLGRIPVGRAALFRAIELNGRAVDMNRRAFLFGRLYAVAPERVQALAGAAAVQGSPSPSLAELVARRAGHLRAWGGRRPEARFRRLVEEVTAREGEVAPGSTRLAAAVARGFSKLLAYKDEYEVARLYTDGEFRRQLEAEFEGDYRVELQLAPPRLPVVDRLVARRDPETGRARKWVAGPWIFPVLRVLARLRFLRGTPVDPFDSEHRRLERRLADDYEARIRELLPALRADLLDLAVEIAALPEQIRGFDLVKEAHLEAARARERELLAAWRAAAAEAPAGGGDVPA